ncbi:hypothetical protein GGS21DRAFT_424265 [Xylaria nigripes]|nr:hypothetical protein GGS21DRAFT_424265 [Xylaria nigripes]
MATAIYANHSYGHGHYGYPQPPPSPPMDETKCSLPSISNLLVMADAGSPSSEYSLPSQSGMREPDPLSPSAGHRPILRSGLGSSKSDTRPNSSHYSSSGSSRAALPPTPPMSTDSSFEGYNSPSIKSLTQVPLVSESTNYYYETTPPADDVHRQHMSPTVPRLPVQAQPYSPPSYASSSYSSQPAMSNYYTQPLSSGQSSQMSGLFYSRPLPQNFPPLPTAVSLTQASGANPWQHHHYISPSSAASFPQSQDRYICQTCNKAFSRPSSLRIHSHSHTGEKPFKCPHAGCGKAFSVRSNMKRHERGCHSFESSNCSLR